MLFGPFTRSWRKSHHSHSICLICTYAFINNDIMIVYICPKTKSFIFSLQLKSMFTRARKVQCIDPRPVSISETGRSFDDSLRCPLRPSLSIPPPPSQITVPGIMHEHDEHKKKEVIAQSF